MIIKHNESMMGDFCRLGHRPLAQRQPNSSRANSSMYTTTTEYGVLLLVVCSSSSL